jgi:hypothetical protein
MLLVRWSMLSFCMPLIYYLHVVVVLVFMFMLQFGCSGFCNHDWNNIVPGGGDCCLLLSLLYVVYCCLIRLSRVPVLRLQLGLLVLLSWVLVWCLFLFGHGLQMLGCCICGWIFGHILFFIAVCIEYY